MKAFASDSRGRRFRTVAEVDEYDDDLIIQVAYWVRNMDPGEKVVIKRSAT